MEQRSGHRGRVVRKVTWRSGYVAGLRWWDHLPFWILSISCFSLALSSLDSSVILVNSQLVASSAVGSFKPSVVIWQMYFFQFKSARYREAHWPPYWTSTNSNNKILQKDCSPWFRCGDQNWLYVMFALNMTIGTKLVTKSRLWEMFRYSNFFAWKYRIQYQKRSKSTIAFL